VPKKVLLLAYYYPPLGGIGSQRSQKFARYLPDYGWTPIVVTPRNGSYFIDPTLDDREASGVEVVRTPCIDLSTALKRLVRRPGRPNSHNGTANAAHAGSTTGFLSRAVRTWAYIPDGQVGWLPYATNAGREILETHEVDAIYSTSYPVTAHMAAARLKSETGKPWIADFRDLWTENHYADYASKFRKRLDQVLESNLLDTADVLVTVSESLAGTLRTLSGGRKRVEIIRNGFDSEDFAGIARSRPDRWTVTYVGTFYGARQDPSAFLAALKRLIESGRIAKQDVLFNIVGRPDAFVQGLITRSGLAEVTRFTGFVSHREALEYQVNSSLLLLILHRDKANPGVTTGKLYEYLGSRTPILAMVPPHFEAARIVRETGAGVSLEASDAEGIEQALLDSYRAFKSGADSRYRQADLSTYERSAGARRLAELLSELTTREPKTLPVEATCL
jgi:glycosyltransferase involved in cell wall biosynthesis